MATKAIPADLRGRVWSAIRAKLPHLREEILRGLESQAYELESVALDQIARKMADAVVAELAKR